MKALDSIWEKIAPGRGRRVTYGADRVNEVVQATTQTKPPGATH